MSLKVTIEGQGSFEVAKECVKKVVYKTDIPLDSNARTKDVGSTLEITGKIAEAVNIPVIASGGAGKLEHFYDAFTQGKADAVLAASLFHFREIAIPHLKQYLAGRGVPVRLA